MRTKTGTTSRASLVVAAAALAGAVLAGCGGSSASASALCKDYAKLGTVSGTDTATLRTAAALYRKLALEAPAAAKADLNTLADDEDKVANGDALSVDNSAAQAASDRADSVLSGKCPGKQQTTPTTGGGNGSSAIFCSDVQTSLTVEATTPACAGLTLPRSRPPPSCFARSRVNCRRAHPTQSRAASTRLPTSRSR